MIYVSPAYEQVWGRTCASLYQNPMSWAEAIHPDDREQSHVAILRGRCAANGGFGVPYPNTGRGGEMDSGPGFSHPRLRRQV